MPLYKAIIVVYFVDVPRENQSQFLKYFDKRAVLCAPTTFSSSTLLAFLILLTDPKCCNKSSFDLVKI